MTKRFISQALGNGHSENPLLVLLCGCVRDKGLQRWRHRSDVASRREREHVGASTQAIVFFINSERPPGPFESNWADQLNYRNFLHYDRRTRNNVQTREYPGNTVMTTALYLMSDVWHALISVFSANVSHVKASWLCFCYWASYC